MDLEHTDIRTDKAVHRNSLFFFKLVHKYSGVQQLQRSAGHHLSAQQLRRAPTPLNQG